MTDNPYRPPGADGAAETAVLLATPRGPGTRSPWVALGLGQLLLWGGMIGVAIVAAVTGHADSRPLERTATAVLILASSTVVGRITSSRPVALSLLSCLLFALPFAGHLVDPARVFQDELVDHGLGLPFAAVGGYLGARSVRPRTPPPSRGPVR